jgi:hypothetical protein
VAWPSFILTAVCPCSKVRQGIDIFFEKAVNETRQMQVYSKAGQIYKWQGKARTHKGNTDLQRGYTCIKRC